MSRMYDIIQELCRRDGTDVTKMCRALKIPRSTLSELASGRTKQLTLKHAPPSLPGMNRWKPSRTRRMPFRT